MNETQETNTPSARPPEPPEAAFDLGSRGRLLAGVVGRLRDGDERLRVLAVGDDAAFLPDFFPADEVVVAEAETPGSTYEDGAFDYAVSLDALRGSGTGDPGPHLSGLRRVSRKGVLVSSPFDSAAVRTAEREAGDLRRSARPGGAGPEGAAGPLPDLDGARRFFESEGDAVFVLPNGYLPHWLAMACVAAYGSGRDGALEGVGAFHEEAVPDDADPAYRQLVVSLREPSDVDLGGLSSTGAGRGADLFGALAAVLPLTAEVQKLNARLARKDGDLARKDAQIEDLSHRLAERVTADRLRHDQQYNELRRDRDRIKRENNNVRQQLAEVTASRGWRLLTLQRRVRIKIGQLLRSR